MRTPWRCHECPAHGQAPDRLAALIAFEKHYIEHHYKKEEEAA